MRDNIKIGIALGSGAARGLAHIGVLQVFEEHQIPIHMVSGSSMGALIGSLYCCGIDPNIMEKIALHLDEKSYLDFTVPRKGFIKGNRIQSLIQTLTKNMDLEDLTIPMAVVTTDLCSCRRVVFDRGKIHKAVRASISIPGVFEPVEMDGCVLVDGGVIDRVPVSILREMGADMTIAVDVGFRGNHQKAGTILETILQSLDVMEWELAMHKIVDADIVITPEIQSINPASLVQAEECIRLGREAAQSVISQIKEKLSDSMVQV